MLKGFILDRGCRLNKNPYEVSMLEKQEGLLRRRAINLLPSLDARHPAYPWFVLITVMLSTFMVVLDGTIVNVAIPTIMAAFGQTINQVVWVSTAI